MGPSSRDALVRTLLAWYEDTHRDLPWRRTGDPYAIWVSEGDASADAGTHCSTLL
jgi:A/G-specific adenine glycosylase